MAGLTEEKLYAAFGLEQPAEDPEEKPEEGQDQQEPATPEQESTAAQSVETEVGEETEPNADSENDDADTDAKPEELTPEQRRQNAARRREQQQRETVNAAVQQALQEQQEKHNQQLGTVFSHMQLTDIETGQPITTMEQFHKWQRDHSAKQLEQDLKAGRLTPEALDAAISAHPAVQQAQAIVEQAQQQAQAQQEAADKQRIDADMEKIRARDPSIQEVADLLKMPEYAAFKDYVAKGHTFDEAHYLATRERREQEVAEAARQKALNDARSKDHLTGTTAARGAGAATVPANVMAMYRKLNPKASEAEIVAHYNKYLKK